MSLLSNSLKRMNKKLDKQQRGRQEYGSYVEDDLWFASPRERSQLEEEDPIQSFTHRHIPPMEPRNPSQQKFLNLLTEKSVHILVGAGPAGTGKTALAIYAAVRALCNGTVSRIILTRPAVSAGEELGFLPGDMQSKLDPYLRPLFDILYKFFSVKEVQKMIDNQIIEICPLAFARGRTFTNSFIICDEMQNATKAQLVMIMTRLGPGSKMVLVGDPQQHDRLPGGAPSGLPDFLRRHQAALEQENGYPLAGIRTFKFSPADVVRHPVVQAVLSLYEE